MYNFRRATYSDIDSMVGLLKELTELEEDFDFDEEKHRTGIDLLLAAPEQKACIIVAEVDGEVVGMCSGQTVLSTAMGGISVWVEDVVVTKLHRGKGLGRKILERLEEWAQCGAGAKRMQLWADKDNTPAITFYNRNGWKKANGIVLKKNLSR